MRFAKSMTGIYLSRIALYLCAAAFASVLAILVVNSIDVIGWEFLSTPPKKQMTEGGILPTLLGTLALSVGAIAISLPLGVMTAFYLTEYAPQGAFNTIVRISVANLAGVPSIVFGLFGLTFFVVHFNLGVSLAAGILTLAVLSLPMVIQTTEEAIKQIPAEWKEASLALGASRLETMLKIILPNALPGILTGAILSVARVAGETAAVMYTGVVLSTPKTDVSLLEPVMALPNHIYVLATSSVDIEGTRPIQYGAALVLILIVVLLSASAIYIREKKFVAR